MSVPFYRWFIFFLTSLFIIGTSLYLGVLPLILMHQATMWFSALILAVYTGFSIHLGYKIYNLDDDTEFTWFVGEMLMGLAILGTMSGLTGIFSLFIFFDITNVAQITPLFKSLGVGVAATLITSIEGLAASIFLKWQAAMYDAWYRKSLKKAWTNAE